MCQPCQRLQPQHEKPNHPYLCCTGGMPSLSSTRSLIRAIESLGSMSISISLPVSVLTWCRGMEGGLRQSLWTSHAIGVTKPRHSRTLIIMPPRRRGTAVHAWGHWASAEWCSHSLQPAYRRKSWILHPVKVATRALTASGEMNWVSHVR